MKKTLLIALMFLGVLSPGFVKAQTFTVPYDTVFVTMPAGTNHIDAFDNITNTTYASGMVINWRCTNSNFPADWCKSAVLGICDNKTCYANRGDTLLWNRSTMSGSLMTSLTSGSGYALDTPGQFDLQLSLSPYSTSGSYFLTVNLADAASSYSKNITFVVNRLTTGVTNVNKVSDEILLYPNPAINDLNVVYDASLDIKTIAVYNIIGKVMSVYKVPGTSANLNLENVPSGIYFLRLYNADGENVITKKFTKQ